MPSLPAAFVVSADAARLAQFRAAWAAVGLPADAVEEWRACMIPGEGSLGNAVAQYSLVRHALASGLPRVLVFEDDAVPCDTAAADLSAEIDAAAARGDAAIRLGWIALPSEMADPASPAAHLYGSHAYALLSPEAMRDYLDAWPKQGRADCVFDHMRGRVSRSARCLFAQHTPPDSARGIHHPAGWSLDAELGRINGELRESFRKAREVAERRALHVAWTVDVRGAGADQFRAQLLASIRSVVETTPEAVPHLLFGELDSETLAAASTLGAKLHRIPPADLVRWQRWTRGDAHAPLREWPAIVFARLYLPRLLPDVRRVLYLDADTLARKNLASLASLDLGSDLIAAAPGVVPEYGYNSGVLLLDLDALRRELDYASLETYADLAARSYKLPDQTLLNRYFAGRIRELDVCYNLAPTSGLPPESLDRAAILHYYNGPKPTPAKRDAQERGLELWRKVHASAVRAVAGSSTPPPRGGVATPPRASLVDFNPTA